MYTVLVNDPPAIYKRGYFPRKVRHKAEAIALAKAAVAAGATMARVQFPKMGELDFRPPAK